MSSSRRLLHAPRGVSLTVGPGAAATGSPLVLLHGSDGHETDLLPLAGRVAPGSATIALRGAATTPLGHAFFDRRADRTIDEALVRDRIDPVVDAIEFARSLVGADRRRWVIGFSNGAVMAAALVETRPDLFTAAVLIRPAAPFRSGPVPVRLSVPVLVLDARHDARRTPADGIEVASRLRDAGATVQHTTLDVGHGITPADEDVVRTWLARLTP